MRLFSGFGWLAVTTTMTMIAACGLSFDNVTDGTDDAGTSSSSGPGPGPSSSSSTGGSTSSSSSGDATTSSSSSSSSSSGDASDDACFPQQNVCNGKCGNVFNGCTTEQCPGCAANETCNDATNLCECVPRTRDVACTGIACGSVPNGCGQTYDCTDTCMAPQTCGGGTPSLPNVCGCTDEQEADTCARTMYDGRPVCGTKRRNNCGRAVQCANVSCPTNGGTCVNCVDGDGDDYRCCR